jgi:hypothetical protein
VRQETSDEHSANGQPRCEFDHTLKGVCCEKRGEVSLDGLLLCERHAMQLTLEERADTLQGIVLVSGRVLQSADIREDALRAHRVELQREEAIEQLRFTHTQLQLLRMEPMWEGGELMALLRCPCQQGTDIWGEFWWVSGGHQWVFFDDEKSSETYAEQVEHCPGCGTQLERKNLTMMHPVR